MAFSVAAAPVIPKFSVISEYSVFRIGLVPTARVVIQECIYILEQPTTIISSVDVDGDGKFEVITVSGWAGVIGRTVSLADSTKVGVITAASEVSPNVQITLDTGSETRLDGQQVFLVVQMPVGTPAYQPAELGRRWELFIDGSNPDAMARLSLILGTVHVEAALAVLTALGNSTITQAQVAAAVQGLAAKAINIDGLIADQAEQLELDRRAGSVPWLSATGDVPQ